MKTKAAIIKAYQAGQIDLPEAVVRMKGLKKGWTESKIQKRIKVRDRFKFLWNLRGKIPFRPLGGTLEQVGERVEDGVEFLKSMRV